MTQMRSAMVTASSWSWVTKRKVVLISRCKLLEKALHLPAKLGVERAERLVEENEPRLADDGAGKRDALLLAAAELRRVAPAKSLERDELQRSGDAPADFRLADPANLEAVTDIRLDRHVREEGVVLEDGVEGPPVDRHRRDVDPVEDNRRRASASRGRR